MLQPRKSGRALLEEIDGTLWPTPVLWWLGRNAFIFRFATITFYIDPHGAAPLDPAQVRHADLILSTDGHLDAPAVSAMLEASKQAKLVLPKSAEAEAHAAGIAYHRMTTTNADLRIEFFKDGLYGRVYALPSARPSLDWSPDQGYPHLGYLIRFGRWTVYHPGDCVLYDTLADRLRPFNVSVALLPVGGQNFSVAQAAQLAADIGASWIVPMHAGASQENDFIAHMLGHRPEQPFKVFQPGEKWTVPEE
ncbi:MAG TPA: MBL fold metallo-hydrolase [Bryobacteraceae bacterium]|nr:MBL fold metallo-hydrolase [Bryobacteraceae bacterium]